MSLWNIHVTYLDYNIPIPRKADDFRKITNRKYYGIVFCPDGVCHYTQNGITYTNDNSHVLLLPKGGTYTLRCESDSLCPLINFDCEDQFDEIISLEVENSKELLTSYDKISKSWIFNKNESYYSGMKYLYGLFEKILLPKDANHTEMPPLLMEAKAFISQNYTNYLLELDDIAKHLNISTVYFRKIFKNYYGIPPMKYINQMRIRQAKALLRDQMISIELVAELSGFSSIYSFSRTFKLMSGYTPSEYRKKHILD